MHAGDPPSRARRPAMHRFLLGNPFGRLPEAPMRTITVTPALGVHEQTERSLSLRLAPGARRPLITRFRSAGRLSPARACSEATIRTRRSSPPAPPSRHLQLPGTRPSVELPCGGKGLDGRRPVPPKQGRPKRGAGGGEPHVRTRHSRVPAPSKQADGVSVTSHTSSVISHQSRAAGHAARVMTPSRASRWRA